MATQIRHEDTTMDKCNLLIIGRSGNGLKSVMNSILHSPNNMFQVIDCTGIGDPEEGKTEGQYLDGKRKYYSQKYEQLKNVNAIVFVMKYGVRFTKQEKDAVKMVKDLFGREVFQKNVVIVFTYGDLFYQDVEDTEDKVNDHRRVHSDERNKLTDSCIDQESPSGQKTEEQIRKDRQAAFMTWCTSQTGDIDKLFQEVNHRCVLFDNRTKDETRKLSQLKWFTECFSLVKNENLNRNVTIKIQKSFVRNNARSKTNVVRKFQGMNNALGEKMLNSEFFSIRPKLRDFIIICNLFVNIIPLF